MFSLHNRNILPDWLAHICSGCDWSSRKWLTKRKEDVKKSLFHLCVMKLAEEILSLRWNHGTTDSPPVTWTRLTTPYILKVATNLKPLHFIQILENCMYCGEPAISHDSHHVSLVQWTICLLPATRDTGLNPLGELMWNRDSPVSVVSLHWWPQRDPITGFVTLKVLH